MVGDLGQVEFCAQSPLVQCLNVEQGFPEFQIAGMDPAVNEGIKNERIVRAGGISERKGSHTNLIQATDYADLHRYVLKNLANCRYKDLPI